METQYFTEYYLVDALRLASHFAERYNGTITEGIGDAALFPQQGKGFPSEDTRFIRVECKDRIYAVAFTSEEEPTELKHRNKSLYRVLVGEEVRQAREKRGMSIEEVAEKSGFRPHSIGRIEEGRWDFDIPQLGLILDAMGATLKIE